MVESQPSQDIHGFATELPPHQTYQTGGSGGSPFMLFSEDHVRPDERSDNLIFGTVRTTTTITSTPYNSDVPLTPPPSPPGRDRRGSSTNLAYSPSRSEYEMT